MGNRLRIRLVALTCIAAIAAGGCGSSDGAAESAGGDGTTPDSVAETTAAPAISEAEPDSTESTEAPAPSELPYTGPLTPMAVVGAQTDGELIARSGAGESNEKVRSIFPYSMDLGIIPDSGEEVDGSTWVRVVTADARDLDGWVNADFLIEVEGDIEQPAPLFEMASSVRNALLLATPANRMAERTHRDGLRVSLDGSFNDEDPVYQSVDLSQVDNSGSVVDTEVSTFIEEFVSTNALQQTDRISINTRLRTSDTEDNSEEFFPDSIVVELHYSGEEGDEDATWESVIMVFLPELHTGATSTQVVEDSTAWAIAGLALDAPTT